MAYRFGKTLKYSLEKSFQKETESDGPKKGGRSAKSAKPAGTKPNKDLGYQSRGERGPEGKI